MGSGLDIPMRQAAADQDPALVALHQKLLSSAQSPLKLGDSTDFTPGAQGTDSPGVRVAAVNDGPPPPVSTDARPGAVRTATADAPPPVVAADAPQVIRAPAAATDASAAPAPAPGKDAGSSCDDASICNWRPNPNSQSQLTKDWFAAHQAQSSADVDCNYTVKFGDCLESIARRELKHENKGTDSTSIKAEVAKIIQLNKDHYKSLDCNKEFIKEGWKLKLSEDCAAPAPVADKPAPPAPVEAPPPAPAPVESPDACHTGCNGDLPAHVEPTNRPAGDHPAKADCAPCGADVVVDNPRGRTYYEGKEVGDHDRTLIRNGRTTEVPIPAGENTHLRRHRAEAAPSVPGAVVGDATQPAPRTDAPATPAPAAVVDTPAPVLPTTTRVADAPAPAAATRDASSDADLIPGTPAEVAAPAPVVPVRQAAITPRPPAAKATISTADVPADGNDLSP